jgi:hypothetical protein
MATKQFVNLLDAPYSRRGSFLAFANDNKGEDLFGKCTLWLCTCRSLSFYLSSLNAESTFRQIKLQPLYNGNIVPCILKTTAEEVIIETRHGEIRFCIGERSMAMARGTEGLGLRVTPKPKLFSSGITDLMDKDNRYLLDFFLTRILLTPLSGTLHPGAGYIDILPDDKGVMAAAFEDFTTDPDKRPLGDYPSYEACVQSVREEFGAFCESVMPSLPGEFEEVRLQSLWQTWSMMVEPDGESDYKRTMVKMIHSIFEAAFVWQQPMQAVWLSRDKKLAWDVFCSCFDFMDKNGRLMDAVGFKAFFNSDALKPPVHGIMLNWLMDNGRLADVPLEEKKWLLEHLVQWTDYFFRFRDKDGDGLTEYQGSIETGWEDATYYTPVGFPLASPDLNTFLALQLEAVARLGAECGMSSQWCDEWMARAKALTQKIVEKFWDGEKWIAFNPATGAKSETLNISLYMPLLLGKRLPQEIIDKSIETIFSPEGFDTPYGLASEGLTSDFFRHGFTGGSIITPAEFLMVLAFEACDRPDLAKKVAVNYCRIMKNHGFFHIHNALTGKEDRSLTAFGERGLFWSAWASSCFFFLADQYGD